ncbi:hypothetical protein [Flavobacterium cerinum]|uniref:YopX protein domain-containing protein n=1 Tax=Flavobacterium cerinum TaxID=2502784 RepID=A0ABY5IWE1_9FLAO|nr:hypothetical protein [Flavobacterium cerinum]UUC46706.1 hypothetical protein NOX80_05775 [Flavobacterium cerinum]
MSIGGLYNENRFHGIYYKFNKDGTYDKYSLGNDGKLSLFNNDGDLIDDYRPWKITKDSILLWRHHRGDVVLINDNVIIVRYGKESNVILIKEDIGKMRKSDTFFDQKMRANPDKYKSFDDN